MNKNQVVKLLLVGLATPSLIWLAHLQYQGKPFSQTQGVISCLVEVTLLVDTFLKQEDSES